MIAEQNAPRLIRLLPVAVVVTLLVAGAPMLLVWVVRITGLVSSPVLATSLGVALSLTGSGLGGLWWERRRRSRDVLFGDLMIWGWVRRYLIERRLASAAELLGVDHRRAAGRELTFSAERFSAERQGRALEQLAASLEARDPYTHGHSRRVARYATMIARRMGLAQAEVGRIRAAAAMHDVGKIETPIAVLHKPGRLTDAEFDAIKRHPVDGARLVARVGDDELTAIVRHHHERLDGTGYPEGLTGSGIPLGARIIAVADTFDAITSERPYRPAKAHKAALEILRREAGKQLDPDAVSAFCTVYFGRRTLGAWIAATNTLDRLASWLGTGAVGSAARGAAIAASAAALGAGVVAVPASAARSRAHPAQAHAARVRLATATGGPTFGAPDRIAAHTSSAARRSDRARVFRGTGTRAASPASIPAGAGAASGTSTPVTSAPATGSPPMAGTDSGSGGAGGDAAGGGKGGSGKGGSTGSGTGTTTVASTDGAPAAAVTVTPGQSGGLPSVAVSVGGTPLASAGGTSNGRVGVSVAGTVGVSVGGSGSPAVSITVGGGSSGLPPLGVSLP
jgi:hypothetical protein